MIVYCDTSFLVSFLNEEGANHKATRRLAAKLIVPILFCVIFYFGAGWQPKAFDTFACSFDLEHWAK